MVYRHGVMSATILMMTAEARLNGECIHPIIFALSVPTQIPFLDKSWALFAYVSLETHIGPLVEINERILSCSVYRTEILG